MQTIEILYKDDNIIAVIKPAGISSEHDNQKGMPDLLTTDGTQIYTVHRLDRDVSGVMVYVKNKQTAAALSSQMADKNFTKEYLAVVCGEVEKEGRLCDLLFHDRRLNKTFVVKRKRAGVKEAALNFTRIAVAETENGKLSLVKIKLETGRTHQIRVQFGSRKTPVAGDRKYGSQLKIPIALFSHRLGFENNGESVVFKATPEKVFPWTLFKKELDEI